MFVAINPDRKNKEVNGQTTSPDWANKLMRLIIFGFSSLRKMQSSNPDYQIENQSIHRVFVVNTMSLNVTASITIYVLCIMQDWTLTCACLYDNVSMHYLQWEYALNSILTLYIDRQIWGPFIRHFSKSGSSAS